MIITRESASQLLKLISVRPTKDLGQNFLVEPNVTEKIVGFLSEDETSNVLEIGPGLGSLTHFLNEKIQNLTCVDIDHNMIMILSDLYKNSNIRLLENDVRKIDLLPYDKIIGNLPYNITTELVLLLLLNAKNCKEYVLMIQAEALNRFIDVSGKDYGPSSILVHLLGEVKKLLIVKPGSFYPAPQCNSVVFSIKLKENCDRDYAEKVYKMSKQLFLNRRKTILNNLSGYCGKEKAIKILSDLHIQENKRPEELSIETFEKIYKCL